MSRKYEAIIVIDTKGKSESVQDFQDAISKELEANGAKLSEIKPLGRKTFAYNARKLDGAQYIDFQFEAEPSAIDEIKAKLSLNTDIYMQYYQKLD